MDDFEVWFVVPHDPCNWVAGPFPSPVAAREWAARSLMAPSAYRLRKSWREIRSVTKVGT